MDVEYVEGCLSSIKSWNEGQLSLSQLISQSEPDTYNSNNSFEVRIFESWYQLEVAFAYGLDNSYIDLKEVQELVAVLEINLQEYYQIID